MPYTLPNHRNFDQWLTELPDEDLQYFCDAIDPLAEDQVLAQETTAYLLYLILHFYGPHALSTEEMTDILRYFGINLAMVSFKVIPGSSHGLRNEMDFPVNWL